MDLKDILAGRLVVLPDGRGRSVKGPLDGLRSPPGTAEEPGVERWRKVVQGAEVATRDHEHVAVVYRPLIAWEHHDSSSW